MFALIGWIFCFSFALVALLAGYSMLKVAYGFGSNNKDDYFLGWALIVVGFAVAISLIKFAPFAISFSRVA